MCVSDPPPLIRSENVAEWFVSILPTKSTQSLFLLAMFPIYNSPNADASKIRWTVAVKDAIDFLLPSFNVFLAKEEQKPSLLQEFVLSGSHRFRRGQQEN